MSEDKSIRCLHPNCRCVRRTRGNCQRHYQNYLLKVRRGEVSWKELEEQGLVLPANKMARHIWNKNPPRRGSNEGE